jgi:hypothetical protein
MRCRAVLGKGGRGAYFTSLRMRTAEALDPARLLARLARGGGLRDKGA